MRTAQVQQDFLGLGAPPHAYRDPCFGRMRPVGICTCYQHKVGYFTKSKQFPYRRQTFGVTTLQHR